jgi:hypothetical protein
MTGFRCHHFATTVADWLCGSPSLLSNAYPLSEGEVQNLPTTAVQITNAWNFNHILYTPSWHSAQAMDYSRLWLHNFRGTLVITIPIRHVPGSSFKAVARYSHNSH